MKGVQTSLLNYTYNSTDEQLHHHLCPEGENSRCKQQKARPKELNTPTRGNHYMYILPLSNSYSLLTVAYIGSKALLERCLAGYTQNPNESLHSTVWKLCPKELFLGGMAVEIAYACMPQLCAGSTITQHHYKTFQNALSWNCHNIFVSSCCSKSTCTFKELRKLITNPLNITRNLREEPDKKKRF